jgi:hypothetical protein
LLLLLLLSLLPVICFQESTKVVPSGETAPKPVTTTRRRKGSIALLLDRLIVCDVVVLYSNKRLC